MLDLGRKSQQIGGILELINELAEQTNILAINATIEAAGAGESGKRFAVVGEEIRRLADRVGASTKEIRQLIDDIRTAVNKTVMTTEGGNKAVEAGARQFAEVASSFEQISALVATTTEAAREIELSTKQQSTAVEQVNSAVSNVAQATRENEASSNQTLQTASELVVLSRALVKIVHADAGA
jgi:methyl-accepting chemotaxis protein